MSVGFTTARSTKIENNEKCGVCPTGYTKKNTNKEDK